MIALVGANLLDGGGRPMIHNVTALIDGERIAELGPRASVPVPEGTQVIDASGLTLMPGLIDCHDHLASKDYTLASRWGLTEPISMQYLRTARAIEDSLAAGYTCIRDAGGLDAGFRMAVEQGLINGPRLLTAVTIISSTGGIGDRVSPSGHHSAYNFDPLLPEGACDGVEGVRAKVRQVVRAGADVVKFATTGGASGRQGHEPKDVSFNRDEIDALVDEARILGRKAMCHALGGPGLRDCIEAGVQSVEHGCYLAEDPDLIKMMADNGTFLVPTFMVYEFHSTVSAPHIRARGQALMKIHQESALQALAAGVKVVAGTDAGGFVHGDNARELEIMVERGIPPMQAIQGATGWAAECLGLDKELGTLQKGKLADLLLVEGDPLKSIGVLRDRAKLKLIMKGGKIYSNKL